jgi:hypothetical protein
MPDMEPGLERNGHTPAGPSSPPVLVEEEPEKTNLNKYLPGEFLRGFDKDLKKKKLTFISRGQEGRGGIVLNLAPVVLRLNSTNFYLTAHHSCRKYEDLEFNFR